MKKKALGKGLGALIPDSEPFSEEGESLYVEVPAEAVQPNRFQPRNLFHEEEIQSLADSIKENGLLQPVTVRRSGKDSYEIISGERRFRAMLRLGYKKIPVIIRDITNESQMLVMALIENLQREDLNPIEEALGYQRLIEENGLTQQDVARVVSKSRVYVTNTLRLLKLEPEIIKAIEDDKISAGHGRALLSFENSSIRLKLLKAVTEEGLSVRELEKMAASKKEVSRRPKASSPAQKDPGIEFLEHRLQEYFGTRVSITHTPSGGSLSIKYYSEEDLTRILDLLNIEVNE
ncbi:MAG TPA: ParB/RepB/Spo0J family partition protein [Candidatus Mcinerneyibacteriales bacterium]|nr:ParB/RepB/Spo0J family partition protein [Candidatus Mcinerneyibacteriales bacterium]HPJ70037.1 ParB/RepB/Spo0J family partition protein [Candidatus Mcinerneyibacteriales bacterium]